MPDRNRRSTYRGYVVARCMVCRKTRRIYAGDVPKGDHPMCEQEGCYGMMIAESAHAHLEEGPEGSCR